MIIMTSQHPHQQQQQLSQYYNHTQSQSSPALPHQARQSSPAIYLQHSQAASASAYPSTSAHQLYTSQASLAAPTNQYYSGLLQNLMPQASQAGPSTVTRYGTPAQAGSPPASYLPVASSSTSASAPSQAQTTVSSRIVSSLQSLVSLLEKQNAKLDKHDESLKTLSKGFDQLKTETTRCTEGIESFSKTMSKKLKTMSRCFAITS